MPSAISRYTFLFAATCLLRYDIYFFAADVSMLPPAFFFLLYAAIFDLLAAAPSRRFFAVITDIRRHAAAADARFLPLIIDARHAV